MLNWLNSVFEELVSNLHTRSTFITKSPLKSFSNLHMRIQRSCCSSETSWKQKRLKKGHASIRNQESFSQNRIQTDSNPERTIIAILQAHCLDFAIAHNAH